MVVKTAVKDDLVFRWISTVTRKNNLASTIFIKYSVLLQCIAILNKTQTMQVNTPTDK